MELADEVMKLLDRGATVVLRKSGLGSYSAISVDKFSPAMNKLTDSVDLALGWDGVDPEETDDEQDFGDNMPGVTDTDGDLPSRALYRLVEKATTGRRVGPMREDGDAPANP